MAYNPSLVPREPRKHFSGPDKGRFQSRYGKPSGRSPLRPEQRADSNGKIVTRWVKDGSNDLAPSASLAAHTAAGGGTEVSVPANIDWEASSNEKVGKAVATIMNDIDNPYKVWDNFDALTRLVESKHGPVVLDLIRSAEGSLASAWRKKHGENLSFMDGTYIRGEEGYGVYSDVNRAFQTAVDRAHSHWANLKGQDQLKNSESYMEMRLAFLEAREAPEAKEQPSPAKVSFFEKLKGARKDGDIFDEDSNLGKMGDVLSTAMDATLDRHSDETEVPTDVGGSTVAWSDFNPFRKKK
jgi:hypothetical protein